MTNPSIHANAYAPGGIGAREATLVVLLGPRYGTGVALAISLALRVSNVAGELLAVLLIHTGYVARLLAVRLRRTSASENVDVSPTPARA
jgi:hypothetical protein